MTLCLVTDRRRLGRALGLDAERWDACLLAQIKAATEAGVDLVQLRETDLEASALFALTLTILREVPAVRGRLVINERLDVALASGAAGVHLRDGSVGVGEARRLARPGFRIGRSVHAVETALEAQGADYLIAGTVLSTPSKAGTRLLGWEGLRAIVTAAHPSPVFGIGGLTLESVPQVTASGAAGLAAIGAFIPGRGQDLESFVQEIVRNLRLAFDSSQRVS